MEFETVIANARIKSTRSQIKITYNNETIRLNKRKLKKFFLKVATFCICIHFVGHALEYTLDSAKEKVDYLFDVAAVRVEESKDAEKLLLSYDLNTEPNKNNDWCNDYSVMKDLTKIDIYGLCRYCGREETEKVLATMGYYSWNHYLKLNGYVDQHGNPSTRVWENYMEARLVNERNEAKQNDRSY